MNKASGILISTALARKKYSRDVMRLKDATKPALLPHNFQAMSPARATPPRAETRGIRWAGPSETPNILKLRASSHMNSMGFSKYRR